MPSTPRIVFNFADGQNKRFVELAEALVGELRSLGATAEITHDAYPEAAHGRVFVLVAPHEYVEHSGFRPPKELLARCIGISPGQPSGALCEQNLELARDLGAVFDINQRAIRQYARAGIAAEHLTLGYAPAWDRIERSDRDIDILFLGRMTARRGRALSLYANTFERFKVHIQLADGRRPGPADRPDEMAGAAKLDLLSRSKVLLSIHGEEEPYFEWLHVAEAICAGAMIVTEHSSDIAPLRHGEHLLTGGVERLGLLCGWAAENNIERERIRHSAYELLRERFPVRLAAERLVRVATELDARAPCAPPLLARSDFISASRAPRLKFEFQPDPSPYDDATGRTLRALKSQTLALLNLHRRLDRLELGPALPFDGAGATQIVHQTPAWSASTVRRLAVVVPLYNHRSYAIEALESVVNSEVTEWELVVVDDGSTDDGAQLVHAWMADRPGIAARLVRHDINRGLAHARNTGTTSSSAPLLLMLDADNALRVTAMGRLLAALHRDPAASFAYGILERFSDVGPVGLVSVFPWDPERLRASNYIDAMALIRREALDAVGHYSTDGRLALGWEDYDLWARIAESGGHAAFVPEIIARYRVGHSSMVSMTDISTSDAYAAIADHAPRLMRGVRIPH